MIERGCFPPAAIRQRMIEGVLFLAKFYIGNVGRLKKFGQSTPQDGRYVRPPHRYTLPEYKPGLKYCNLNAKYLRPTLYCNSHAPEIIALAHQLGAYEKPAYDFAESAFEFVKQNIPIEILPLDGVSDTLRRGTGTCLHKVALFVALCRAAGLKTRYKLYTLKSIDTLDKTVGDKTPGKQWYDKLGNLMFHGEAEVFINGEWIIGSVGLSPERQASLNLPITRFGEITLGVWYTPDPESIVQLESLPYGLKTLTKFVYRMAPAAIDKANANLQEQCNRGRAILEEKGETAYDSEARKLFKPKMPEAAVKARKEIIFKK